LPLDAAEKLANWDPYDQNNSSPFFDLDWMFGIKAGFDVLIGNPPYIQLMKLKGSEIYAKQNFNTYSKSTDLYCLFYEKGIQLLKEKGNLNYITSNSWMRTKYGRDLRILFREKFNPLTLVNFEDVQIFENAVVESNILIIEKKENENKLKAINLGMEYNPSFDLSKFINLNAVIINKLDDNGWNVGEESTLNLKSKIEKDSKKIIDLDYFIARGVTTGCNEAFFIDRYKKNELIKKDNKNEIFIKKSLRGRNLQKYSYFFDDYYLIYSKKGFEIEKYPHIMEHFLSFKQQLDSKTGTNKWYEFQASPSNDIENGFNFDKIIWGELSNKAKFTYDDEGFYLNNTVFFMVGINLKFILSIFNSKLAQWYFEQIATSSGMGTNRWLKYKIEQFPIKVTTEETMLKFENLVNQILAGKKSGQDTSQLEHQVDIMVYYLYELSYEEACVIDKDLSKDDYKKYRI